jgi:hypothetical protein
MEYPVPARGDLNLPLVSVPADAARLLLHTPALDATRPIAPQHVTSSMATSAQRRSTGRVFSLRACRMPLSQKAARTCLSLPQAAAIATMAAT